MTAPSMSLCSAISQAAGSYYRRDVPGSLSRGRLIDYFSGEHLVVINKSPTPRDRYADLLIKEPIGQVFSQIKVKK